MKGKNYLEVNHATILECINLMVERDFKGLKATSVVYLGSQKSQPFRISLEEKEKELR